MVFLTASSHPRSAVLSGGTADTTTVNSGGLEYVYSGGIANNTTVSSGGHEGVHGVASGTVVYRGGVEVVTSGAVAERTLIDGGTLRVGSGGVIGTTTFATGAGGLLRLDSSLTFKGGLVAGFGKPDKLDLRDLAFVSGTTHATWTQTTTSRGTLAVIDGSHIARLRLLGQYVTADFHVSSDKHGGTFVTEQPVSASQTAALVNPHQT
jgi:autotransporter passenger strand-loop-strand repeat protein